MECRHQQRFRSDDRGAGAVEFALIAPVLISMCMGIIEFGTILYTHTSAVEATRDVARRIASNRLSASSASTTAKQGLPGWIRNAATVTVTQTTPGTYSTNQITVAISFPAVNATPTTFLKSIYGSMVLQVHTTAQQEQ